MTKLWETETILKENTLTVNIARLRRKLEGIAVHDFLRTRRGKGYEI